MAGAYPDPPSYRMAYHEDGTQIFRLSDFAQMTPANLQTLNSEAGDTSPLNEDFVVVFPEPRDIHALWMNGASNQTVSVETSVDTTNGVDGTWVTNGTTVTITPDGGNPLTGSGWRSSISSVSALNVKAIRTAVTNLRNIHIYGEISPEANPKRIEFWHPTADLKQPPNWFDWGHCPRQSTDQVGFRLKNMSPAMTANDVAVTLHALTDTVPSVPAQHFLSQGMTHWQSSINLGDIAPNGLSPVAYLRRVTPSNAVLTPPRWAITLKPTPAFWS